MSSSYKSSSGNGLVVVIDDDELVRLSLDSLFGSVGLAVRTYPSVDHFKAAPKPPLPCCLVLDVRMPGASGLDYQVQHGAQARHIPIIFITGVADVAMGVRAMKSGAVDFIEKPYNDQTILDAVSAALNISRRAAAEMDALKVLKERATQLTAREREIMAHVVAGSLNKVIAHELGLKEVTVKIHRSNVMRKMQARSLAELVRQADLLGMTINSPAAEFE